MRGGSIKGAYPNVVVTAEEEKIRDAAGYSAIAEIHREMDDDHSGSIDRKETTGVSDQGSRTREGTKGDRTLATILASYSKCSFSGFAIQNNTVLFSLALLKLSSEQHLSLPKFSSITLDKSSLKLGLRVTIPLCVTKRV
ncbi:unnamed protein product [Heligmosomoides polygyrus]|uniref:STIM1/2 EF-hand domain-containing protein n=1 Tax=Heligmosomoides polygyrus TaxID=6339 RepID=A0A3P7Y6C9_HELPZ|nr:unnamed protein product [Heligmosomoides polygyrus]